MLRLADDLAHGLDQLFPRALPAQRKLRGGMNKSQRRAQFVRGIRRELNHSLDGGVDSLEHFIQRQREPLQFVLGGWNLKAR